MALVVADPGLTAPPAATAPADGGVKEFYAHDLVYKFDDRKRITFGVVSESYEGSDTDEYSNLQKGQIVVHWNNSTRRQICRQSKVHLLSRNVIPGEIVRRLEDGRETQRGYCKRIRQVATLQIVESDKVVEHVLSSRLCYGKPLDVGDAVGLGDKFGRIQGMDQMLRMRSKCGSIVEVRTSINYQIKDYWNYSLNGGYFEPNYPGQTIICTPMHLKDPKWVRKSKAMKRKMEIGQTFTIQSIDICMVEVWWYLPNGRTEYAEVKDEEIKKLKILPYAEHLMIGDRFLMKLKPSDILMKKRDWIRKKSLVFMATDKVPNSATTVDSNYYTRDTEHHGDNPSDGDDDEDDVDKRNEADADWCTDEDEDMSSDNNDGSISVFQFPKIKSRKRQYPPKLNKFASGSIVAVEVLCTECKVTVVWQDGTEEKNVSTTELYYSVSLDDHEFFPGEWVVPHDQDVVVDKWGVVQKVNFAERTAEIKWFTYTPELKEHRSKEICTSEHSVYDLKKHHKYVFRPGSTVKSTATSALGRVSDSCPQGFVVVQWLNGTTENCWPQDIELLPEYEDLEIPDDILSDYDDSEDCYSWETESVESFEGDITDEINLQNMAAKVDYIRNKISYLREAFRCQCVGKSITKNFQFLKDLLSIYDNSSYLDKLLGTSFFSLESKHFQALLQETKKKAKTLGIEMRGRLFSRESLVTAPGNNKTKNAEKENLQKIMKMESKVNEELESHKEMIEGHHSEAKHTESCPSSPDAPPEYQCSSSGNGNTDKFQENLCIELLLMLKIRMDLAYAEIVSRIGGRQALTVLQSASDMNLTKPSENVVPVATPKTPEAIARLTANSVTTAEAGATAANPKPFVLNMSPELEAFTNETFSVLDEAPETHRYYSSRVDPKDMQKFVVTLQREYKLLKESLPAGVWVRAYDNRTDLLSVMIRGPEKTPYEDGLFLFDIQLCSDYPKNPPYVHYISYISEVLNPNLYVEGKVCVSLLGTWMGKGSEVWGANSTLLQLIVSIQGLILVAEPYYNEAGYERQTHTQQGYENSRTYNEFVILKLVQSMTELLNACPKVFRYEVLSHFQKNGEKMCRRIESYCGDDPPKPDYPLLPVSKGLKLSLVGVLRKFRATLSKACEKASDVSEPHQVSC